MIIENQRCISHVSRDKGVKDDKELKRHPRVYFAEAHPV